MALPRRGQPFPDRRLSRPHAAERNLGNAKFSWQPDDDRRLSLVLNHLDLPEAQDPLGLSRAQMTADPSGLDPVAETFNTRKRVGQTQGGLALFETRTAHEIVTQTHAGGRATDQNTGGTLRCGLELGWPAALWPWGWTGNRPLAGRHAGAEWRYVGPSSSTAATGGYQWRGEDWSVDAFARVDNLLDRRHVGSVIVNDGNGRCFELAPGRTWWGGMRGRWQF